MDIKNYTSEVPAERSIGKIETLLIGMGARNIMKEYDGFGKVDSIAFSLPSPTSEGVTPFRLPVRKEAIKKLFLAQYKRVTKAQEDTCTAQAERTAWRNMHEWVQLQATMIKLDQVEFMEAFMPYIYSLTDKKTFFERMKESNFKQLSV